MIELDEKQLADNAKRAYDLFIEGFIVKKRMELFDSFQEASLNDKEGLIEIKRMLHVLNALEIDIKNVMFTGKMVDLKEEEDNAT